MEKQTATRGAEEAGSDLATPDNQSSHPQGTPEAHDLEAAARWEFPDRRRLLYALVGNDFGPDPESKLDEIRAYKLNEAQFLLDTLKVQPGDRVLDLGSNCGFIGRAFAPLCSRLYCLDISDQFLDFCKDELRQFPNVEFHQMEFAKLEFLAGKRINKGYSNAVFIHFNFFDIVLYFTQLFEILEPGGLFVFGMSDTDCLDVKTDRYFGVVLEKYRELGRALNLMHWNSSTAVCAAAGKIGFSARVLCRGNGSAMVLLEKPAPVAAEAEGSAPSNELMAVHRQWNGAASALKNLAYNLTGRYPKDREARFLLADILRGAGMDDLAFNEYKTLLENCPPNELHRVQQGIEQSQADRGYFPPAFAHRLSTAEYAVGHNAAVWREYAGREIQRGREIVRMVRQVTPLRGKRVLDVGSGYGGMLISMAEQGANVVGVEIDPERARMGKQRLADLAMQIPYHEADICSPGMNDTLGTFDVVICQDVLEHVLDPSTVIRSLCSMLQPGGVVYIQIPNKYGIDQMMSDHHYGLTGLTVLSRPQAIEYWQLATGEPAEHYTVGYERGEKFYMSAFARAGVKLSSVERFSSVDHVLWHAPRVSEMCKRLEQEIYPGLRPALQKRIRHRMTKVAQLYAHASQQIIRLENQPELFAEACDSVVRRLCVGLWRFLGIKTAGS
jgi:2-polyprenyl-3-methyl-5-hydroxy-6-metoxy-1,4-benzoquinol methylase